MRRPREERCAASEGALGAETSVVVVGRDHRVLALCSRCLLRIRLLGVRRWRKRVAFKARQRHCAPGRASARCYIRRDPGMGMQVASYARHTATTHVFRKAAKPKKQSRGELQKTLPVAGPRTGLGGAIPVAGGHDALVSAPPSPAACLGACT